MMATSDPDIHLCYSPLVPLLISPHHARSEQTVVPNWLKYFFSHQTEIFSPTATDTMGQTLHYEATASNYYAAMYLKWVRLFTSSQFYCYWDITILQFQRIIRYLNAVYFNVSPEIFHLSPSAHDVPALVLHHPLLSFDCFQHPLTPTSLTPPLRWGFDPTPPPLWLVVRVTWHGTDFWLASSQPLGDPQSVYSELSIKFPFVTQPGGVKRKETWEQTVASRISYKNYQYLS